MGNIALGKMMFPPIVDYMFEYSEMLPTP